MTDNLEQERDEKMKSFTMRVPPSMIEEAQNRAGLVPLSAIIRRLIKMWLRGEITLDLSKSEDDE